MEDFHFSTLLFLIPQNIAKKPDSPILHPELNYKVMSTAYFRFAALLVLILTAGKAMSHTMSHSHFASDLSKTELGNWTADSIPNDALYQKALYISGGDTLPYRILFPENYDHKKKYPLVLFLHGAGERGNDNEKQLVHGASLFLKNENRIAFPCIVLVPQCPE